MQQLFNQFLLTNTVKEVTTLLENIIDKSEIDWVPVGGFKDNVATINMGTDPAAGLAERITNAIDAVIELEWYNQGKPDGIENPRLASQKWFDISEGKLRTIDNASEKRISELAKKIRVTLRDSERENYPTVEIRDLGIGIKGDNFKNTILGLHGQNKLTKMFLMGAYGQGGSTALSYNNYTLIASKPTIVEPRETPFVYWTIVRINRGDVKLDKLEWFEYCVDKQTQMPFKTEINNSEFSSGTLVRHIAMDVSKYTGKMTGPTSTLWYLTHHYLFDPIIPFTITGERKKDLNQGKVENRSVFGNNRRLTKGGSDDKNLTQYQREVTQTFRDGKVTIYYWVLTLEGSDKPEDRIKNYTQSSYPIIITHNGQKQGQLQNTIIKTDLKLPYIDKYLVVQIECDHLDNESKRHLFSSTRESLRDTSILDELKRLTIDTLNEDDELKVLDKERKDRYLKRDTNEANDKLRKRLASRINSFIKAGGGGQTVKVTDTKEAVKSNIQLPIPVSDPPTFLEITTSVPKEVFIGKPFSIKFKTDAHPSYFLNPDAFLAVIDPHSFGSFTGTARIVDGYGIAYFKVKEGVDINALGNITLELRPPRQKTLSSNIEVIAVQMPEEADINKGGNKNVPNIEIIYVTETMPFYKEHSWNYETVASVEISHDSVAIFLNDSNKNLSKLLERAQRYNVEAVESMKNHYREHVAFCAYIIHQNKIEERLPKDEGKDFSHDIINVIKQADLANASETIVGMINEFFQVIVKENAEVI